MRKNHDKYEYVTVYVDDPAVAVKDPKAFIDILETKYKFKKKGLDPSAFIEEWNFTVTMMVPFV
jgi:hypothetical protein